MCTFYFYVFSNKQLILGWILDSFKFVGEMHTITHNYLLNETVRHLFRRLFRDVKMIFVVVKNYVVEWDFLDLIF